ncbi:MAG: tetratricopeptide (TPR) repeat protein, partial [Candidatus Azotimanducaceae bacterium]
TEAYAALYKSTWNYEWRTAAYFELAMLDCRKGDYATAIEHCEASLDTNRQNNKAQVLKALAMRKLGQDASEVLNALLEVDPLDH